MEKEIVPYALSIKLKDLGIRYIVVEVFDSYYTYSIESKCDNRLYRTVVHPGDEIFSTKKDAYESCLEKLIKLLENK